MQRNRSEFAKTPPVALTIAGFDPSNGAGITADLQVFAAHGLFGMSAITALTVQSTQGVAEVHPVSGKLLRHTLDHLVADIVPQGIKIGMLGSQEAIEVTAAFLRELFREGKQIPVVLDPVLRSSSGATLLEPEAVASLKRELLPLVSWITPNWTELGVLAGISVCDLPSAGAASKALASVYPELHIVATGGDSSGDPVDLWRTPGGELLELRGERVETTSTHGTGCAFSSALTSQLVLGTGDFQAVKEAKRYVEAALRRAPVIGHGSGPMELLWPLRKSLDGTLLG